MTREDLDLRTHGPLASELEGRAHSLMVGATLAGHLRNDLPGAAVLHEPVLRF